MLLNWGHSFHVYFYDFASMNKENHIFPNQKNFYIQKYTHDEVLINLPVDP